MENVPLEFPFPVATSLPPGISNTVQASQQPIVHTNIGDVTHLTPSILAFKKMTAFFSENEAFKELKHFVSENRAAMISCATHVAKSTYVFFTSNELVNSISGTGLAIFEFANVLTIPQLAKKIKVLPASFRNVKKTSAKVKLVFEAVGLVGKVIAVPEKIIKGLKLGSKLWEFTLPVGTEFLTKMVGALGAVSLVLSTGLTAVKIWDLKSSFHFGNKVRERSIQNLLLSKHQQLQEVIKDPVLKGKLDEALKISEKASLKALYKTIRNELKNSPVDYERLEKLLEKLELVEPNNTLKDQIQTFKDFNTARKLFDANEMQKDPNFQEFLKDPQFKEACKNKSLEIQVALEDHFKEMVEQAQAGKVELKQELKKGNRVNFQALKNELETAVAQTDPNFLQELDVDSKSEYLKIISEYNSKKLGKVLAVDANQLQGTVKKVQGQVEILKGQKDFSKANELLSDQYLLLKGRVKERKEKDGWGLGFDIGGMFSSAVSISVLFGALEVAGAVSTLGISIGLTAAVLGIILIYKKYKSTAKFEEEVGIKDVQLKAKWDKKLTEIKGKNPSFVNQLTPSEKARLQQITDSLNSGKPRNLFSRFVVPSETNASKEDIESMKKLNRMVVEMNKWTLKQPGIQKGILLKRQQELISRKLTKLHQPASVQSVVAAKKSQKTAEIEKNKPS